MAVVREWILKAEEDLVGAHKLCEEGLSGIACFLAQQSVEKYVKAVLTFQEIAFPMTHNISKLVARLPDSNAIDLVLVEQERLTDYATVTRYPGDYEPVTLDEAREAVELARRARESLRKLLPAEVCGG